MIRSTGLSRPLCAAALAATILLAGTAPTLAGDNHAVPFDASLYGTAEWDLGPIAHCQGAGTATHLGLTVSECTAVLDLASYGPHPACAAEGTGNALPNVNTIVLTAANGDRLVIVSVDLACEIEPFTGFHSTGIWTVHSAASTGRFAGATGTGNCEGTVDFAAGVALVTLTGEISY